MRTTILLGSAALAAISVPASAQYYAAPTHTYPPPTVYVYTPPPPSGGDERDDWQRDCRGDIRDDRRDGWEDDCWELREEYDRPSTGDYDYRYDDDYRSAYRDRGSYSYRYPVRGRYGNGYAYGYRGGYSGGYAEGHGGGYVTTQSGGVVVTVEQERGERYVPVIREEVIEETYETMEYETVRERITTRVPVKARPRSRQKYIKSVK